MDTLVSKKPYVSVLMSVYNGERFLHQAVTSVLNQDITDYEFIIVDDGSNDHTKSILDKIRDPRIIRVTNSKNKGLVYSLNKGLVRLP